MSKSFGPAPQPVAPRRRPAAPRAAPPRYRAQSAEVEFAVILTPFARCCDDERPTGHQRDPAERRHRSRAGAGREPVKEPNSTMRAPAARPNWRRRSAATATPRRATKKVVESRFPRRAMPRPASVALMRAHRAERDTGQAGIPRREAGRVRGPWRRVLRGWREFGNAVNPADFISRLRAAEDASPHSASLMNHWFAIASLRRARFLRAMT